MTCKTRLPLTLLVGGDFVHQARCIPTKLPTRAGMPGLLRLQRQVGAAAKQRRLGRFQHQREQRAQPHALPPVRQCGM